MKNQRKKKQNPRHPNQVLFPYYITQHALIQQYIEWTKQSTMFVIKKRIEGVVKDAFETQCERQDAFGLFAYSVIPNNMHTPNMNTQMKNRDNKLLCNEHPIM